MMSLRTGFFGAVSAILVFVAVLTIAGCGERQDSSATQIPPTALSTDPPIPTEDTLSTPTAIVEVEAMEVQLGVEASHAESPLPLPESPLSAPSSPLVPLAPALIPITSSEGGGLSGQIIVARPTGDVAVAGLLIGLAEVILDEDGMPKASGYEASVAPKTSTDDFGRFVFDDIKPGMYTLILDAVITQYQLNSSDNGDTILVEILPNAVVDLGMLRYASLPIPGYQ